MQVKLHPDNFMFRHNEAQTKWLSKQNGFPNKMAFQTILSLLDTP